MRRIIGVEVRVRVKMGLKQGESVRSRVRQFVVDILIHEIAFIRTVKKIIMR